jgi:LPS-assembly protein
LTSLGAYQVGGFVTYGKIDNVDEVNATANQGSRRGIRAYVEANGRFQFSPEWSLTSSIRLASDKTVTGATTLTRDDRLRNFVEAERITPRSYLSIAGWAFEGLRVDDVQKQFPIALPAIDGRLRLEDPLPWRPHRASGQ